ncbi:Acyl-CoA dehydrogenase family member 10 [Erysiphe neolycopersici]|uniref:Acyl-CoA dehydrogenase family member 10 n=1 Tax=Erysiphe neolycopersici TaxID=212602 RepID=A0A420HBM1_9PEZI|nr:Acyl-CoA dehydrogenase family member 10 [Erysiphe neolycopersici]
MGSNKPVEEEIVLRILHQSQLIMEDSTRRPKVIIFDIGGVCVNSPFQAVRDYEIENNIPLGWINYGIDQCKPDGIWHRLERGEVELDQRWNLFWQKRFSTPTPPMPRLDVQKLFWSIIAATQNIDHWMFSALRTLKKSEQFILIALTNTFKLPPPHQKVHDEKTLSLRSLFDIYISSAEIGLRKPDPKIYKYALEAANSFTKKNAGSTRGKILGWENEILPSEVLFLDDIGENVKGGKQAGFSVIKVELGKTREAVEALEVATGLKLTVDHPKASTPPRGKTNSSKL